MLNGNHKNSGCGFSEALISYLYNESAGTEKVEFEAHLKKCSRCADEFAAFSGVHFSINDWKSKEFAVLETPIIEIPYEKTEKSAEVVKVASATGSWLSGLRNFFSLSPRAWSLATAAIAVMVLAGIALFALNSRQNNDIASKDKNNVKPVISPTVENTPPSTKSNSNENNSSNKQTKPFVEPKSVTPEVAESNGTNTTNNRVVKISNTKRPSQKPENVRQNNNVKTPNKNVNNPPKGVIEDEDEDNTLRLAEIFDEIDTK